MKRVCYVCLVSIQQSILYFNTLLSNICYLSDSYPTRFLGRAIGDWTPAAHARSARHTAVRHAA